MKFNKLLLSAAALLALASTTSLHAQVGGGATIHNAASMTFSGGQVTAHVNVSVLTIGTLPTFIALDSDANSGDTVNVTYYIISNSNGSDLYDMVVSTNDIGTSAPSGLSITPSQVTLGASITSAPSTLGVIYIAAGSETNLTAGNVIRLNLSGTDYYYTIDSVTPGTPASTVGNTTTPETPTALALSPVGAAPAIVPGNVVPGIQVGERGSFVVSFTTGSPTTPGVNGTHEIVIDGTAAEPDANGDVVAFTDTGTSTITVLSGDATLVKAVCNVTETVGAGPYTFPACGASDYAVSGVTARTGDVLEYRLTAGTTGASSPADDVTNANITDSIPEHASYVAGSTTLNGGAEADVGPNSPLIGGLQVNSASGAAGVIVAGETAVVTFAVQVD